MKKPISEYLKKCPKCSALCPTKEYENECFQFTCMKCKFSGTYNQSENTRVTKIEKT